MHEYSVMSEIVRRVLETADEAGATSITAIDMEVGGLTFLAEDQMRTAYDSLVRGTIADGSELRVITTPVRYTCGSCGSSGPLSPADRLAHMAPLVECGECGEPAVLGGGKECRVTNIEAEVPDND